MADGFQVFGPGPQAQIIQQTPRLRRNLDLANLLARQGTDTSPIQHPLQGFARLAQALAGQKLAGDVDREAGSRSSAAQQTLADALMRSQRAKPFLDPDDPNPNRQALPGTSQMDVFANVLASNPDTAQQAAQIQFGQFQQRADDQRQLRQAQALIPIQAQGAAATATAQLGAQQPFVEAAEARAERRDVAAFARQEASRIRLEDRALASTLSAEGRADKRARDMAKFEQGLKTDFERTKAKIGFEMDRIEAAIAEGQPLDVEEIFKQEGKLRGEFTKLAGEFLDVQAAFGRINAAQNTSQGDISLLISFMKMLDPGSVVRESEFATAETAASVPERLKGAYMQIISGERLTQSQRNGLKAQSKALFDAELSSQTQLITEYQGLAEDYGLDSSRVVRDLVTQGDSATAGQGVSAADIVKRPEGTIVQDDETGQKFIVQGGQLVPFGGQ